MPKIINRIGQLNINNQGLEMIISSYKGCYDVDVYFPKYEITMKGLKYLHFSSGNIKCPLHPDVYGLGYIGIGKYNSKDNKDIYKCWSGIIERVKLGTCTIDNSWLNFQNYAKWHDDNFYEVGNEKIIIAKGILNKYNTHYSPNTCIFAPENIDNVFRLSKKSRNDLPVGVTYRETSHKYIARISMYDKLYNIGSYNTPNEAFNAYKIVKEKHIKEIADRYSPYIPAKLYDSMYKYKIDIHD